MPDIFTIKKLCECKDIAQCINTRYNNIPSLYTNQWSVVKKVNQKR